MVFGASSGTVNLSDGLNIRSKAGTNQSIVATIPFDASVSIVSESTDSNGNKWYQITSSYGSGYVYADYITVNQTGHSSGSAYATYSTYTPNADFEAYLEEQNFPEGYRPFLRELHTAHPNWRFVAMHTGLNWDDVIYRETHPVSTNLVPNSWDDAWKSAERAAFDTSSGSYVVFDSGGYVAASEAAVKYYMDPRNNMGTETVFQFLSNRFDASTQTVEGISAVIADSFMEAGDPGEEYESYAELIYDAGQTCGVNPLTIASMLIVEQGRSGSSDLISGKCEGYEGYYNFFNVGAYAADGRNAVENGLIYAKKAGWDSPADAIVGGAQIYADNYVYNGKSTIYFQKYNVMNGMERVGTGQYMTAIYAASTEGRVLAAGYKGLTDGGITFEIPVYENMPEDIPEAPSFGNNISYLKNLSIKGSKLDPSFNSYTTEYTVTVDNSTKSVDITAEAVSDSATIAGTGTVDLNDGEDTIQISCTSSTGRTSIYTIHVKRGTVSQKDKDEDKDASKDSDQVASKDSEQDTGKDTEQDAGKDTEQDAGKDTEQDAGKDTEQDASEDTSKDTSEDTSIPSISSTTYQMGERVTGVTPKTSVSSFISNLSIADGTVRVFAPGGKELINDSVTTESLVKLYNNSGEEYKTFTIVIKGDNNGDGKVNSADALRVQRQSVGSLTLSDAQLAASDINGDGKYNSADALLMQRYSVGTYEIAW